MSAALLEPGTDGYEASRRPAIARFHDVRPAAIVRCASPGDIAEGIAYARRAGLPLAVRSGGHCFAGRSSTAGVLLDVSAMDALEVGDGVVRAGGGVRLGALYDALAAAGRAVAGGCGPTVGLAGLVLGGGVGILGRRHGLTCDQLVAAEVVLADGRVVSCDEGRDADLFWALRGAGGGQFGVVTSFVLRTVPAPATTVVHARRPLADGAAVLSAWQDWAPDAPDELAVSALVTAGAGPPSVHLFGAVAGTREQAVAWLSPVGAGDAFVRELGYREAKRWLAEHGPGDGAPPLGYSKSELFGAALPDDVMGALLEHLDAARPAGQWRTLDFMPLGGAYNRVARDATAFAHRGERFVIKHDVSVAGLAEADAAREWLRGSWAIAHPFGTGRVYPNFPDPSLDDAGAAYHGENLERLRQVKAAYDPDGVFRFEQSL